MTGKGIPEGRKLHLGSSDQGFLACFFFQDGGESQGKAAKKQIARITRPRGLGLAKQEDIQ